MNIFCICAIILSIEKEGEMMSLNIKRIIAYFLDLFIITLITGALAASPLNPYKDEEDILQEEFQEIIDDYTDHLNDIDETDEEAIGRLWDEYITAAKKYTRDIVRNSIFDNLITCAFVIAYFAFFAHYLNNQTAGKRIMKIKVLNKDGTDATLKQMLLRTILLFGMPITLLNLIFAYTCSASQFYGIYNVLYWINIFYQLAIVATMFIREDGRGLHDLCAGTKIERVERSTD